MNVKAARALRHAGAKSRYARRMIARAYPTHRDRGELRALALVATPQNAARLRPAAVEQAAYLRTPARDAARADRKLEAARKDRRRLVRLAKRQAKRQAYLDKLAELNADAFEAANLGWADTTPPIEGP